MTVDGPAASGKSTAAELIAKRLNFSRLDSGLLYRAITFIVSQEHGGQDLYDSSVVEKIKSVRLELRKGHIFYNGTDITENLHTPSVDKRMGIIY